MNRAVAVLFFFLSMFTACEHKDLWYEESNAYWVNVAYDWSQITDHELPKAMRVLFYPLDGERTEPYVFDFSGNEGGMVRLPAGDYEVVSFNHDTENILIGRAQDIDSITATTQRISHGSPTVNIPDSLLPKDCKLYDSPEWFCRAHKELVTILPSEDSRVTRTRASSASQVVTLTPEWALSRVNIIIKGIGGIQFVDHVEGTLTGLANTLGVSGIRACGERCAVPFTAKRNDADSTFNASFYVWGLGRDCKQLLNVMIWGQDRNWHTSEDISKSISVLEDSTSHNHSVSVNITFNVEFHHGKGSGFKPTVDDYKEEHHDIPVK